MKASLTLVAIAMTLLLTSCSSFKAERVDGAKGDEKALSITDKWVMKDTETAVKDILEQIQKHKGFQRYLGETKRKPKIFIMEIQNETSEPYFPIADMNDELLNEFSASGEYTIIDNEGRSHILKEVKYQSEGMVDPAQMVQIGKQTGADLIILGAVRMTPETRDGKTIKQYTVNLRMTNLKTSEEVLRVRAKTQKYSEQAKHGW
jgi:PBP1b-binding outer membrane lipoprotein LpoB